MNLGGGSQYAVKIKQDGVEPLPRKQTGLHLRTPYQLARVFPTMVAVMRGAAIPLPELQVNSRDGSLRTIQIPGFEELSKLTGVYCGHSWQTPDYPNRRRISPQHEMPLRIATPDRYTSECLLSDSED